MSESKMIGAEERIKTAFLSLLREKHYSKINVTEVVNAAKVNRSTFYRHYENIPSLFERVCADFTEEMLSPGADDVQSKEQFQQYVEILIEKEKNNVEKMRLLAGEHGDIRFIYLHARAVKEKLSEIAKRKGLQEEDTLECISLSTEYFSSFIYVITFLSALPKEARFVNSEIDYNLRMSLFENISELLSLRLGGKAEFHYILYCAKVKLSIKKTPDNVTVTELLKTAGLSRTEFYLYYENIDDFLKKTKDATITTVIEWGSVHFFTGKGLDKEDLEPFIKYGFIQKAIVSFFENSGMGEYMPRILSGILGMIERTYFENNGKELPDKLRQSAIYYIVYFAKHMCMYLLGGCDYPAFSKKIRKLSSVRRELNV